MTANNFTYQAGSALEGYHRNLGFTVVFNVLGLALAVLGFLPPVLAAAAQSMPDFAIVGNSSRLLQTK